MAHDLAYLMPVVVPLPLGGLASELGTLTDRLLDIEARRTGAVIQTLASYPIPAAPSNAVTVTPITSTVGIAGGGSALILAGFTIPSGLGAVGTVAATLTVLINGTSILPGTNDELFNSPTAVIPMSMYWTQGDLALGPNTFELQIMNAGTSPAWTAGNLYLAVIPT